MTVELLRGYRVRSDSEESSVYNFAESELIIPDIPLKSPNRTDIVVGKIKIDFIGVHSYGGFNVQVRYSGANERNYNFLCLWTSDESWEVQFGYKIDRDSALRILNEYHRFMDSMICLESIPVEDIKCPVNERWERYIKTQQILCATSSCDARWSFYDERENDYYGTVAGSLSAIRNRLRQSTGCYDNMF